MSSPSSSAVTEVDLSAGAGARELLLDVAELVVFETEDIAEHEGGHRG